MEQNHYFLQEIGMCCPQKTGRVLAVLDASAGAVKSDWLTPV